MSESRVRTVRDVVVFASDRTARVAADAARLRERQTREAGGLPLLPPAEWVEALRDRVREMEYAAGMLPEGDGLVGREVDLRLAGDLRVGVTNLIAAALAFGEWLDEKWPHAQDSPGGIPPLLLAERQAPLRNGK